jgi:hypothetical protein
MTLHMTHRLPTYLVRPLLTSRSYFPIHDLGMTLIELKELPCLTPLQSSVATISLSSGYIRSSSKTEYEFYRSPCLSPIPP